MNAVGVLLVTEVTYENVPGFDTPPHRAGKVLASMSIALCLAFLFQILLFRRPARRVLRKSMAKIFHDLLTYELVLLKLIEAVSPIPGKETDAAK